MGSAEADDCLLASRAVYARIRSFPVEDSERPMKLTTGVKSSFGAGHKREPNTSHALSFGQFAVARRDQSLGSVKRSNFSLFSIRMSHAKDDGATSTRLSSHQKIVHHHGSGLPA